MLKDTKIKENGENEIDLSFLHTREFHDFQNIPTMEFVGPSKLDGMMEKLESLVLIVSSKIYQKMHIQNFKVLSLSLFFFVSKSFNS